MTQGAGLIGLLYALKEMLQDSALMIIIGSGVIFFFWILVKFIAQKTGLGGSKGPWGSTSKIDSKTIMYGLLILFVIISLYSLIALTAAIFGVNSSPSGGLLVR